ncbi:MAG: hypothetical protein QXE31_04825 [Candidatus Woesearchaeota archaeon]
MNNKPKKTIILDTNFLLIPFTLKVDIFSEIDKILNFPYEFVVLEQTIEELKKIIKNKEEKGKNKQAAKMALKLISQKIEKKELKKVNFINPKQKTLYKDINSKDVIVDDIILEYIDKNTIVATQDKNLKKKLLNKGITTIYLKNKKIMEMQNVL